MNSAPVDMAVATEKDSGKSHLDNISTGTTTTSIEYVHDSPRRRSRKLIMSRIQHWCFLLLAATLLVVSFANAGSPHQRASKLSDAQRFRELLKTVDAATLHDILHEHFKDKYQHGVWPEDKLAWEALHKEDAVVAHHLVQLARRQATGNGNGTTVVTTTAVTEVTTSVTVTSTSTPEPPPPPPTTTPPSNPPTDVPPTQEPPTTTPPPSSSAPPPPPSSTTTTPPPSSSTTSTPASSTLSTTTSSRTSSSASTTRSSSSSRSVRPSQDITTEIVYTTTLPDGAASIVTRVTVVPADQATQATGGTRTNTANASLQTGNGASKMQQGWTVGVGLVGAFLVFAL